MFSFLIASTGTNLILSNTIMGFAAGVALLLLIPFARYGAHGPQATRRAWAWTFAGLGSILTVFGIHTLVSWPLLGGANLIFGDPSVIFGMLLLVASVIIYQTPVDGEEDPSSESPIKISGVENMPENLTVALRPVGYVAAFTGPMLILLAVGGAAFGKIVFRPPPNEFPTGIIAGTGIEMVYFIITYGILGIGAMLLPIALHNRSWMKLTAYCFAISAVLLLVVTFASFLGHVSLSSGVGPGGIPWPPQ